MRYQKPVVMDLSAGARATGQDPLSCYSGNTPGGQGACQMGTGGATWSGTCVTGPNAGGAGASICVGGLSAFFTCSSGTGPGFDDTCTTGALPQL